MLTAFKTTVTVDGIVLQSENWPGIKILAFGWLGIFDGTIGWYANIFLLLGLFSLGNKIARSVAYSLVGGGIAISSLGYKQMWLDENYAMYSDVGSWGIGFYLWMACFGVLIVASLALFIKEMRHKSNPRFDTDASHGST